MPSGNGQAQTQMHYVPGSTLLPAFALDSIKIPSNPVYLKIDVEGSECEAFEWYDQLHKYSSTNSRNKHGVFTCTQTLLRQMDDNRRRFPVIQAKAQFVSI